MERELYEGRLKAKRDRQTFRSHVATAIRERDEARQHAMKDALLERGIPVYRLTAEDLAQDLETLDHLGI